MITVGILAYGSVISDPRAEIESVAIDRIKIKTPFNVEFARKSRTRNGAPTLVPVKDHGGPVDAWIIVVNASWEDASNVLWRRETGNVGSGKAYTPPVKVGENTVEIKWLESFNGLDMVAYTSIAANIKPLAAKTLADLAIESVRQRRDDRDGISYLIAAKAAGIMTPLSDAYEREIKRAVGVEDLHEALHKVRS